MRKHPKLAVLLLIVTMGLIAFCCANLLGPTTDPIVLGLQSYTNAVAIVGITNHSSHQFDCWVMVERKIGGEWPKGFVPGTSIPANQLVHLAARQHTNMTVPVLVYAPPYPWRISAFCSHPPVQVASLRFRVGILALKFRMRKLAHILLGGDSQQIQASTPETEQWEK
jgi:hypothetical protein